MNRNQAVVSFLLLCCFTSGAVAQDQQKIALPAKENFHLFLLAGQSNMAGRGAIGDEDRVAHPRIVALSKDGEWVPAVAPIHFDKSVAGTGLAKSFALSLVEHDPEITIGLIPAACGGSPISSWEPGGYHGQTKSHPYDDALARTRRALENGVLKGILWHQGESDSKPELAGLYRDRLNALIDRFRADLDAPELPFLIGQLGKFPERPWDESKQQVNDSQAAIAEQREFVGFVSAEDLRCKSDQIHFDAASLQEFGKRYADVYLKLTGAAKPASATR